MYFSFFCSFMYFWVCGGGWWWYSQRLLSLNPTTVMVVLLLRLWLLLGCDNNPTTVMLVLFWGLWSLLGCDNNQTTVMVVLLLDCDNSNLPDLCIPSLNWQLKNYNLCFSTSNLFTTYFLQHAIFILQLPLAFCNLQPTNLQPITQIL